MEWQSTQPTLFFRCSERRKFACSWPNSWQLRQRFDDSSRPTAFRRIILSGSADSACALPGPWQASQPCHSGPLCLSSVVFQCGPLSYPLATSSWQLLQVSAPTYCDGSTASWTFAVAFFCLVSVCPAPWLLPGLPLVALAPRVTSPNIRNSMKRNFVMLCLVMREPRISYRFFEAQETISCWFRKGCDLNHTSPRDQLTWKQSFKRGVQTSETEAAFCFLPRQIISRAGGFARKAGHAGTRDQIEWRKACDQTVLGILTRGEEER